MDKEGERELWRRCSQGDITAREQLIVSYRPLVFWIAGKFHVDSDIRQDIIQEGMLALIQAVDKFDATLEYRFTTYAYHKIHGRIINFLERSENRAPVPIPDEYIPPASDDDGLPDEWIDAENAVKRLEGREAEIVTALFYEGKRPREIADEKRIDISHVYRLRRSAISRIRMWLGLEGA